MFNVIITGIASLLTDISSEMVYPLIPLYLAALGAPPAILGMIEGFAESTASLLKVFSGRFSDKLRRRKPVAIAGYAGSTIGKVLLYVSQGWGLVFAGRMVDRFGKGIRVAPRDALIADSTSEGKRGKAFGLHRAMDSLGAAAGVAISIWLVSTLGHNLAPHDYQRIFLFSLIPAALGVAALFFVRERRKETKVRGLPRLSLKSLPTKLKWFLFVITLFALGNSSNQFLLLRAKNLGMSVLSVLAAYLLYNAVYSVLSYPFGHLSDRIGRKRLLVAGYAFYGLVYIGFAMTYKPGFVWLLFALYGVYSALNEGLEKALVADIAPQDQCGTFIGLHSTLTGIGLLPASLLAGGLWTLWGPAAPFWFGGVLGFLAALGLAIVL
ncbi:MAG: MFS transporter [candidate division WOR-3 bacterium]|nr:MFS transporter [candidate division WOR-3 bacterium]